MPHHIQCHLITMEFTVFCHVVSLTSGVHRDKVLVILKLYKYKQLTQFSVTAEPAVQAVFFCFCSNESAPNLQYHNQWRLAGRLVKLPPLVDVASKSFIHTCVLLHQQVFAPPPPLMGANPPFENHCLKYCDWLKLSI